MVDMDLTPRRMAALWLRCYLGFIRSWITALELDSLSMGNAKMTDYHDIANDRRKHGVNGRRQSDYWERFDDTERQLGKI
jgi:hypothetical protein